MAETLIETCMSRRDLHAKVPPVTLESVWCHELIDGVQGVLSLAMYSPLSVVRHLSSVLGKHRPTWHQHLYKTSEPVHECRCPTAASVLNKLQYIPRLEPMTEFLASPSHPARLGRSCTTKTSLFRRVLGSVHCIYWLSLAGTSGK